MYEKNTSPAANPDTADAERREGVPVRTPVTLCHIVRAESEHEENNAYLDRDDRRVELRALLDANHEDRRNQQRDQECRNIDANLLSEQMRRIQQRMSAGDKRGRIALRFSASMASLKDGVPGTIPGFAASTICRATVSVAVLKPVQWSYASHSGNLR